MSIVLPPVPKPALTPPVPAAPELVVIFFVVSVVASVCCELVLLFEQLIIPMMNPVSKIARLMLFFFVMPSLNPTILPKAQ